jgi:DNA processing protein
MKEDLLYKIAITKIAKVGPVTARNLISYCGGVKAVFGAKKKDLLKIPGIGEFTISNLFDKNVLNDAEKELKYIEKNNVQTLFFLDKNYPQRLKHFQDSPVLMYYKGTVDLNFPRIISIVGTRTPTTAGKAVCEEIVEGLSIYNVLIVSGLAYGVDIVAHQKSLDFKVPTIGVLGHGLSQIYPPKHKKIANQMVENGGLLTEFSSEVSIEREHFPMRNRIIAGMCDALIVIETAQKGGSMISAHMANNYSKDVFAVPGRLKDKFSQGCNHLIKTHKASLIESADDIAYIMRWDKKSNNKSVQKSLFIELSEKERQIVDLLQNVDDLGIDKLSKITQLNSSKMAELMLDLEFKGIVKTLPGKRYVLV